MRRHAAGSAPYVTAGGRVTAEALEARVLFAAGVGLAKFLDGPLLELAQANNAVSSDTTQRSLQPDGAADRVSVIVRAKNVKAATTALAKLGFEATASRPDLHFAEGTLPVAALGDVSSVAKRVGRFAVRTSYAPVTSAGSVTSQADGVMEADRVRGTLPAAFDGAGQRVGVISDSFNVKGGAPADVASGDLPAAGVKVLAEGPPSATDEGRAVLQLVHDVAPGASLAFATATGGQAAFAANIRRLADPADPSGFGGANVIVDDMAYPNEPMFQDGVIAQAIDDVVTSRGVAYFSAAGNYAARGYESADFQTASDSFQDAFGTTVGGTFYDFNPDAGGVDTRQRVTIPAGARFFISLQWDDPWYTASSVDTDLDLALVNPANNRSLVTADFNNIQSQDAIELLSYTNGTSAALSLDLMIRRSTGPATNPGRIRYVNFGSSTVTIDEWAIGTSTVIPHAAAAGGQGVGAVGWYAQDVPESSSGVGPATILFSPAGVRLTSAQVRQSPQLAGIDGVDNTFFGWDLPLQNGGTGNGKPNFVGTSAAVAHVAGIAALVRQANPSFTPAQVYERLQTTADDVGPAGFDTASGFGLVNAYDAIYPTVTAAPGDFSDGFETGALSSSYETHSTAAGRIQVTGADGPFAGAKHLTLDSALGGANQSPGLNEVTLHVDLSGGGSKILSFHEREYDDDDHAMPPTFTNSTNADGVALSVDGVNWFRVVSLTGSASTSTYQLQALDLSAIAAAGGITLGADTRIRFQQYGQFDIAGTSGGPDGIAFDDVAIRSLPAWLSAAPGAVVWDAQAKALTVTGAATIVADPGSDAPAITVAGASAVLTIDPTADSVVNIASLTLAGGGRAVMSSHGSGGGGPVRALVIAGGNPSIDSGSALDVGDNVLVLKDSDITGVRSAIAAGFNRGTWLGVGGITSSAAAGDAAGRTSIGYAGVATLGKTSFAGVTGLTPGDVVVKYTYYGDADLNGVTTLDDFTLFLHGYQSASPVASNWFSGDFEYSGGTTLDDFTLFLLGYQRQGGAL
jgi:hypothetical protein